MILILKLMLVGQYVSFAKYLLQSSNLKLDAAILGKEGMDKLKIRRN